MRDRLLINASSATCAVFLLFGCGRREATHLTAVETLLVGRWHYFSYDLVFSANHRFEVVAEPGYPGDVHNPPTGTWRVVGNKITQKYDNDGFEDWVIDAITTGNLRMTMGGSALDFRRVGSFEAKNPDALEARAHDELSAPVDSSGARSGAPTGSNSTEDALSRLIIGDWGDQNNTVFRYNTDHTVVLSNKQFPSTQYNNKGTWRIEGDRLVHILKDNQTDIRRLVSLTADKMVAVEDTMTWELAHLTPVQNADANRLAALERRAEEQLSAAREARVATASSPPAATQSTAAPSRPPSTPAEAPAEEGPTDAIIVEKLRFLGMGNEQYKRGAPLVSTGGQMPIGTTLYPIRLTRLAAAGSTVSDLYFFQDEFGEWKCLWRQINRVF